MRRTAASRDAKSQPGLPSRPARALEPSHDDGRAWSYAAVPVRPRLEVSAFSAGRGSESGSRSADGEDASASVSAFMPLTSGVYIDAHAVDAQPSPDYPDGFRWVQTVTTNVPKGGGLLPTPIQHVDPRPNDDTKPFYETDEEYIKYGGTFHDKPSRGPQPGGTVNWDAVLSLVGVGPLEATRFDSLTYGFSVAPDRTLTLRPPVKTSDISDHMATLRSEFQWWTFNDSPK